MNFVRKWTNIGLFSLFCGYVYNKCLDYISHIGPLKRDLFYVSDSHIESLSFKVNNESLRFNQFSHEVKPSHLTNKSELNIR